nr:reverse transcriptase domain-containing protein [Tanacetum cinerariifolium]
TELTQIDTFYNALNENDQDSLNATAGGNLLSKTTREALHLIENKSKVRYSRYKPDVSRMNTNSRENDSKTDDKIDKLADQISTLVDIVSKKVITPAMVKVVEESCVTCGGNHAYYNCDATNSNQSSVCAATGTYNQVTLKIVLATTWHHLVLLLCKIVKIVSHFDISFADALLLMPNFASTIKSLLSNKDKLFELAKIPLNENCSVMLLKNFLETLGDPVKFLIPCDLSGMDVCHALADLGASINLMPLSIWKKLSLPELNLTRMTLELADRSITRPKGFAKDVFIKVGKFHFLTDFVVVDFEADPRVPLILGRSFLRTDHALIDVYGEEITLQIDVIGVAREEYAQEMLGFSKNSSGGNPTLTSELIISDSSPSLTLFEGSDFILEEIEAYLKDESISPEIRHADCDSEGDIFLIEKLLNDDPLHTYPEYLPPADDVFLAEEQQLPAAVSPTAESPGYITDSKPEMDPEEEDGDNENKEEEEEDLAPTVPAPVLHSSISASKDSDQTKPFEEGKTAATPPPSVYRVTARISIRPHIPMPFPSESEVERLLAIPIPPLSPVLPTSYPLPPFLMPLHIFTPLPPPSPIILPRTRASMVLTRSATPSTFILAPLSKTPPIGTLPLLPIPLPTSSLPLPLLLPSTSCREGIPEADMPLQKRARFTTPSG